VWAYAVSFEGPWLPPAWTVPLVVRLATNPDRWSVLVQECRYQGWAASQGFPAPAVVELLAPGALFAVPAQVCQLVPGAAMAHAMAARPSSAPRLARELGALHADLHRLGAPDALPGAGLADRRLSLVRRVLETSGDADLGRGLKAVEALLPRLAVAHPVLCHGDLHPSNVLVAGATLWVIDWTDAALGDRHGDVARTAWLFATAAARATSATERARARVLGPLLARSYLAAYRQRAPLAPERLRLWEPLQVLHFLAQTVAEELGLGGPAAVGPADRRRRRAWARRRLAASLARLG